MRSIRRNAKRLVLLVLLLICVVAGSPPNQSASEHVEMTYSYSPAGPADLDVTLSHGFLRFDPKVVLLMTLRAIARQVLSGDWDWDSRLLERNEIWAEPPGIQLLVQSMGPQFLERRFAVWTLVRVMDDMVQKNRYLVTAADVRWRGVVVGRIAFIPIRSIKKHEAVDSPNDSLLDFSTNNFTAQAKIRLTGDDISIESIERFGRPHSMGEVIMGTLAAMVRIAERPGGNVQAFVGGWTGSRYTVFPVWWTTQRPSQLSKKNIFLVLVQITHVQIDKNEYRCYKAILRNNGKYIGEGGSAIYPQLTDPGESLNMDIY